LWLPVAALIEDDAGVVVVAADNDARQLLLGLFVHLKSPT
jgi:hypothetical protein